MKLESLKRRIERLEKLHNPPVESGATWPDFLFLREFALRYSDPNTAPRGLRVAALQYLKQLIGSADRDCREREEANR